MEIKHEEVPMTRYETIYISQDGTRHYNISNYMKIF